MDEDDDDDENVIHETKKNTNFNEVPNAVLHHQSSFEVYLISNNPKSIWFIHSIYSLFLYVIEDYIYNINF